MDIAPNKNEVKNNKVLQLFADYFKYIIGVMFLLLIVSGFIFILWPRYENIKVKVSEANDQKKLELETLEKDRDSLQKYKDSFDKLDSAKIGRINKMIPSQSEAGYQNEDLFAELEALVNSQGLVLESVSIQEAKREAQSTGEGEAPVEAPRLGRISVKIKVLSIDYPGLKGLIYLLEHNLRLTDIQRLAFDPGAKTAELEMNVYYYR